MAIVVAGLQVLGDVGKGTEVPWVLGCTGNVPDLMLRDDILSGKAGSGILGFPEGISAPWPSPPFFVPAGMLAKHHFCLFGFFFGVGGGKCLILPDLGLGSPLLTSN